MFFFFVYLRAFPRVHRILWTGKRTSNYLSTYINNFESVFPIRLREEVNDTVPSLLPSQVLFSLANTEKERLTRGLFCFLYFSAPSTSPPITTNKPPPSLLRLRLLRSPHPHPRRPAAPNFGPDDTAAPAAAAPPEVVAAAALGFLRDRFLASAWARKSALKAAAAAASGSSSSCAADDVGFAEDVAVAVGGV